MHEVAHRHVFRKRAHSDALGNWVLGPLVGSDFLAYRQRHWQHHRELGQPGDTKYTYRMDLRPRALIRFLLRCMLLGEAATKFAHVSRLETLTGSDDPARPRRFILRALLVQLCLGASLVVVAWLGRAESLPDAITAAGLTYAAVYVYGLGAVTSLVAALRSVAEHQIGPDDVEKSGVAALRNLRCNAITRVFLGSYGFAEHATHHANPGIPSYHLAHATRQMAKADPRLDPRHGYLEVVRILVRHAIANDRRSPG